MLDWSNEIRYHIFDTRPDTEFNDKRVDFAYRRRYVERQGPKFRGYVVLVVRLKTLNMHQTFSEMSPRGLGLRHRYTIATS